MIKELIDLQRNSKATCAIIKTDDYKNLSPVIAMKANVSDNFLLSTKLPPFAEKLNEKCAKNKICYFMITNLDEISTEEQDRFEGLIKDREFNGYILPDNCIIVFTVKDKSLLKNISPKIYHFAVIAF